MLQRILGLIVSVVGVIVAFIVGLWALLMLAFVAVGAVIAHALHSRGGASKRARRHRNVIEGEFHVVEEKRPGASQRKNGDSPPPRSRP
jgi:beta-lactamase regulating signal transducer with metallopeptidase domain